MLAGAGIVLLLVMVVVMTALVVRPPRMSDGKAMALLRRLSPGDLGLHYEKVTFMVDDAASGRQIPQGVSILFGRGGFSRRLPLNRRLKPPLRQIDSRIEKPRQIPIAAWWIPHPEAHGRCVVIVHGYADAKVGGIAWAPMFHRLGMNILAIDLRCHGESGGRFCSAGYYERDDLSQVLDQVRRDRPEDTKQIVLFGVSLGAAVVAATAVNRRDIDAVIMECPYADFCSAAVTHGRVMGVPGGIIAGAALRLAQWLSAADFSEVRPVDLIPRIPCPLMIIRGCRDFLVDQKDADALERASAARPPELGQTIFRAIPNCGHVLGLECDPGYEDQIAAFVNTAIDCAPPVGSSNPRMDEHAGGR